MIEEQEEQLVSAFRAFTILERALRQAMGEALSAHFGTQWTRQIPDAIRDRIGDREQSVSEEDSGPDRESNLLAFADFSELISLVQHFWDEVFCTWFPDQEVALGLLESIRGYRNALMHSAPRSVSLRPCCSPRYPISLFRPSTFGRFRPVAFPARSGFALGFSP